VRAGNDLISWDDPMSDPRRSARARRALLLTVAALLLAGAAWAYWRRGGADGDAAYVTATVEHGPVTALVTATGTVNPVTTVQVGTYVSGPIQAIDVDFNSPVRQGQRVAKIDPAPFQVKVQRAEASLATARARLAQARADLELKTLTLDRSRRLLGTNVVSQNEFDEARSAHEQARARVALEQAGGRQAQAELEEARINLAYTDITSPVDGVVVARNVDVGQTVAASFQTPTLFLIARNLAEMQVNTAVSESDIGAVREGQPAIFTVDAYPGRDFHGRVTQVRNAPTTVQNVVTYDVVVGVDNPDLALKPGMTATVRIETAHVDDALRLPLRALTFVPPGAERGRDGGEGVWRLTPGGALERVTVRTGVRDDAHVAVVGGDLAAGDVVALALDKTVGPREGPRIPGVPRFR
jgi:HlyD family secretion protein